MIEGLIYHFALVCIFVAAILSSKSSGRDIFSPLWFAFVFYFVKFAGQAIFLVFTDFRFIVSGYLTETIDASFASASKLVLLYFVFWMLGYSYPFPSKVYREHFLYKRISLGFLALIILVLSILLLITVSSFDVTSRSEYTDGALGLILFAIAYAMFSAISSAWNLYSLKEVNYLRAFVVVGLTLGATYMVFVLGGRMRAFQVVLMGLVLWHYLVGIRNSVKTAKLICFSLLVLASGFVLQSLLAGFTLEVNFGTPFVYLYSSIGGRNFDRMENLMYLVDYWNSTGSDFQLGSTMWASVANRFTGNSLIDTREFFMTNVFGGYTRISAFPATRIGEFYMNFGVAGVIVCGLVMGFFSKAIYIRYVVSTSGTYSVFLYFTLLIGFSTYDAGGYLIQSIYTTAIQVIVMISVYKLLNGLVYRTVELEHCFKHQAP
jgi:hypothetical protein